MEKQLFAQPGTWLDFIDTPVANSIEEVKEKAPWAVGIVEVKGENGLLTWWAFADQAEYERWAK